MSTFKTVRNVAKEREEAQRAREEEERNREINAAKRNVSVLKKFMDFYRETIGSHPSEKYPELHSRYIKSGKSDPQYKELERKYLLAQKVPERIFALDNSLQNSVMTGILRRFDKTKFHYTDDEVLTFFERMSHVDPKDYSSYANRLPMSYDRSVHENPRVKQEFERLLALERENREEQRRLDEKHRRETEAIEAERKSIEMRRKAILQSYEQEVSEMSRGLNIISTRAKSPEKRAVSPVQRAKSPEKRAVSPMQREVVRAKSPEKRISENFFSQDRKAKQLNLSKK